MKSRVKVELEASTREDRVDMEAESTRITTTAISTVGQPREHGGDDGVIPVGRHQLRLVGEQPAEAAQEVASRPPPPARRAVEMIMPLSMAFSLRMA